METRETREARLTFDSVDDVPAGAERRIRCVPPSPFRAERFEPCEVNALPLDRWVFSDILVGVRSQLAAPGRQILVPALVHHPIAFETCAPGTIFSVIVHNLGSKPRRFRVDLVGLALA
jgi:hypothetical protein